MENFEQLNLRNESLHSRSDCGAGSGNYAEAAHGIELGDSERILALRLQIGDFVPARRQAEIALQDEVVAQTETIMFADMANTLNQKMLNKYREYLDKIN